MTEYKNISKHPEQYDIDDLVSALEDADDKYHNGEECFWTDAEYDSVYRFAQLLDPSHVYFTGVGSEVRGGKIKLPYKMGSLDQVYEGEIQKWVERHSLSNEDVVLTDKLDGASALVVYNDDGKLQISYSRGDGMEGADTTRHLKQFIPAKVDQKMVVRGEVILPIESFSHLKPKVMSRSGKPYKNPRNMVSGLMNAESNNPLVYKYLHFVAYEIIDSSLNKKEQLRLLDTLGFATPSYDTVIGSKLSDTFLTEYLNDCRTGNKYEIDGIVIDVDNANVRKRINPTRDTLNPAYAVKYKVASTDNMTIATVVDIELSISKHGYIKPTICIEPVELVSVTITKCTGFNMKFIYDNKIQPGCRIRISRAGDVIPMCLGVVEGGLLR